MVEIVQPADSVEPTGGTVTSVSVVDANGLSGTVANPTTTPAITLFAGQTSPLLVGNFNQDLGNPVSNAVLQSQTTSIPEQIVEGQSVFGGVANGATLGVGFNGLEGVSEGFYTLFTDNGSPAIYKKLQVGNFTWRPDLSNGNVGFSTNFTVYISDSYSNGGYGNIRSIATLTLKAGSGSVAGGLGLGSGVNQNTVLAPWHVGNGNAGTFSGVANIMILDNRSAGGLSPGTGPEMQFYQTDGGRQKQLSAISTITTVWSNSPTADLYFSTVDGGTVAEKFRILGNGYVVGTNSNSVRYTVGGIIKDFFTSIGNVGTGEDDLYSYTTIANIFAIDGDKIKSEFGGTFVSSATATREIKLYFAGSIIFDTGALSLSLSSAWTMYSTLIRVNATTVRYMVSFSTEGAALSSYTSVGELTGLTLSGTNILKITGESAGVGAATNDIVAMLGNISFNPANI